MSNFGAQNPYQGYGQQPPGMGGYGQPQYGAPQGHMGMHAGPVGMSTGATPPPARRGTSRALPIMVAAGLAVGVCGGLVVVLGTGSSDAATEKSSTSENDVKDSEKPDDKDDTTKVAGTDTTGADTTAKPVDPPEVNEPEQPKVAKITIDFDVEPKDAEISVDDKNVTEGAYTVELEPGKTQKVTIKAKASGYRSYSEEYVIAKNDTVQIELKKKSSSSSSSGSSSSGSNGSKRKPPKKGSGSLIDL